MTTGGGQKSGEGEEGGGYNTTDSEAGMGCMC
jgi:hypothetical protein